MNAPIPCVPKMQPFFLKTKNNNKNQACLLQKKKKKQLLTQPVMMCPLLLPRNRSPFCPEKWVSLSNVKVLPMICKDNWVRHQLQATWYHLQMLRTELKWRRKLLLYFSFYRYMVIGKQGSTLQSDEWNKHTFFLKT